LTGLQWFGHASVRFEAGDKAVFVDPYQIGSARPVNVVLVTHSHFDHLSPDDIKKVSTAETVVVGTSDCIEQLGPAARVVAPGERLDLNNGVVVEAVPAYNLNKQFHPRQRGWVGYVIEMDGRRVYVAGDTDHISEMSGVRCDVAFLPVGGTYTMTAEEAAAAAREIDLKVAVPIHWGTIVGSRADAERFVELCGERGRLLEPSKG
jgi:L-ascorbate metabolism protein UlaG (beta-lactamase superfamily)